MSIQDPEIHERLHGVEGQVRAMVRMAERHESALALLEQAQAAQVALARLSQQLLRYYVLHEQYGETYEPPRHDHEREHVHDHADTHHGH